MEIHTESSGIDSSPDMNSSVELNPSPVRSVVMPRKLTFCETSPEVVEPQPATMKQPSSMSPPYRKVRALRLFDTPATPKTIIQKSTNNMFTRTEFGRPKKGSALVERYDVLAKPMDAEMAMIATEKPRSVPLHRHYDAGLPANVNPFTPPAMFMRTKKRTRQEGGLAGPLEGGDSCQTTVGSKLTLNQSFPTVFPCNRINSKSQSRWTYGGAALTPFAGRQPPGNDSTNHTLKAFNLVEDECGEFRQAPKRLALQDSNISRYDKEFIQLALLGEGEFGQVYQCLNRLDGCIYAIKKSIRPVAGSAFEKTALNEVYAHAVLGKHDNVVRYYSAWAENNHMLIQNEYCNGGSLQTVLQERCLNESELRTLLLHIAEGLKYIHSNELVHMDLKAGNIFLSKTPLRAAGCSMGSYVSAATDYADDGFEDVYDDLENEFLVTYKIGDLGHVTSMNDPQVEEGDCRYMAREILHEDNSNLAKADIFSLGITLYEAGGGGPLPKNGTGWHQLRNGQFPDLPGIGREFNDLIKKMMHPNPEKRPSSTTIFNHPVLSPIDSKTKAQLNLELSMERQKNEVLLRKLKEQAKLIKSIEQQSNSTTASSIRKSRGQASLHELNTSDRKLRSYSRKKRSTNLLSGRRGIRDNNKSKDY
ncbi:wee1-like protein kinase [Anopheles cruzii]|uniref:wee1-like protein kinase n=1 Tax=Anopheles cruzii TaxID=68878 RepID=UPI0022EC58F8|nr:wee1-like protein kinase [Anopheles cruzii]